MNFTVNCLLCVCGLLVLGKSARQSECGKRLEKGSLVCLLISDNRAVNTFEFNLCTHASVVAPSHCGNETCTFQSTSESQSVINWVRPHFPQTLGLFFRLKPLILEYLSTSDRCLNAVKDMVNWMQNNKMTFIIVHIDASNETFRPTIDYFIEELARKLHEHNFHIGLKLSTELPEILFRYNLERLSTVVDWFHFNAVDSEHRHYMKPFTPLTSFNGEAVGSTKYWFEKVLLLLKPECLVMNVGPWIQKQTAIETAVDPGPGSRGKLTISMGLNVSEICYQLYINETCREYWDEESGTPWAVCGNDFYTYDNARSLRLKVDLAQRYNITRLVFTAVDIIPDNICGDGDPLVFLKAVQGIRKKTL